MIKKVEGMVMVMVMVTVMEVLIIIKIIPHTGDKASLDQCG